MMSRAARLAAPPARPDHSRVGVVRPRAVAVGWRRLWEHGDRGQAAADPDPRAGTDSNRAEEMERGHLRREARAASHRARRRDRAARETTCTRARDAHEHECAVALERCEGRRAAAAEPRRGGHRPRRPAREGRNRGQLYRPAQTLHRAPGGTARRRAPVRPGRDRQGSATSSSSTRSTRPRRSRSRFWCSYCCSCSERRSRPLCPWSWEWRPRVPASGCSTSSPTRYASTRSRSPLARMIGLTLGVDYSLLIVSRFREALESGQSAPQAASLAANTAGRTAAFAGFVLLSMMLVVIVLSPECSCARRRSARRS